MVSDKVRFERKVFYPATFGKKVGGLRVNENKGE